MSTMVLLGAGHFAARDEIQAVFRFTSGQGSRALRDMVRRIETRFEREGIGARVWDVSGDRRARSVVAMRSGDVIVTSLSSAAIIRRLESRHSDTASLQVHANAGGVP